MYRNQTFDQNGNVIHEEWVEVPEFVPPHVGEHVHIHDHSYANADHTHPGGGLLHPDRAVHELLGLAGSNHTHDTAHAHDEYAPVHPHPYAATAHTHAGNGDGPGRTTLAADVASSALANTLTDVTGLSFPVTSGTRYWFRFVIPYTAAAATTGSRWSINGPAFSLLSYRSEYTLTTTGRTFNEGLNAYNLPAASNATSLATGNLAVIEGMVQPSANGTVIARFASEVAASAVTAKAGATVFWQAL